jgi:hypothetical protein
MHELLQTGSGEKDWSLMNTQFYPPEQWSSSKTLKVYGEFGLFSPL